MEQSRQLHVPTLLSLATHRVEGWVGNSRCRRVKTMPQKRTPVAVMVRLISSFRQFISTAWDITYCDLRYKISETVRNLVTSRRFLWSAFGKSSWLTHFSSIPKRTAETKTPEVGSIMNFLLSLLRVETSSTFLNCTTGEVILCLGELSGLQLRSLQ
jgi:hypothetical protein